MKIVLQYIGKGMIAVISSIMILIIIAVGQNSQLTKVGEKAGERTMELTGLDISPQYFVEEGRKEIFFQYQEQTFVTGQEILWKNLFCARNHRGKKLETELKFLEPKSYECEAGTLVFHEPGVYVAVIGVGNEEFVVNMLVIKKLE